MSLGLIKILGLTHIQSIYIQRVTPMDVFIHVEVESEYSPPITIGLQMSGSEADDFVKRCETEGVQITGDISGIVRDDLPAPGDINCRATIKKDDEKWPNQ